MIETTNVPGILAEVSDEFVNNMPPVPPGMEDGTGEKFEAPAQAAGELMLISALTGQTTWAISMTYMATETLASQNDEELREQLVKLGALTVAWIDEIDKRSGK